MKHLIWPNTLKTTIHFLGRVVGLITDPSHPLRKFLDEVLPSRLKKPCLLADQNSKWHSSEIHSLFNCPTVEPGQKRKTNQHELLLKPKRGLIRNWHCCQAQTRFEVENHTQSFPWWRKKHINKSINALRHIQTECQGKKVAAVKILCILLCCLSCLSKALVPQDLEVVVQRIVVFSASGNQQNHKLNNSTGNQWLLASILRFSSLPLLPICNCPETNVL